MTRKRGTGHAPFCSGGHALDVDCATAYDLAQAKRDKDEAAAQLDAPAAKPMNDCSPKPRHADPVSELRKVHDAMHAGKSYSFEQSLLCDLLRLLESPPPETGGSIPAVLFDGYAVLQALDRNARRRTSAENVSDVLDTVVRLLRGPALDAAGNPSPTTRGEPSCTCCFAYPDNNACAVHFPKQRPKPLESQGG